MPPKLVSALGIAVVSLMAGVSEAGILKDHVTNAVNWSGMGGANSFYGAARTNAVSAFIGDGGKITKVGVVFGVSDGSAVPNAAAPNGLDWYVTFYDSWNAFVANPFSVNDARPETRFFDVPSNADWLNIIGTSPTFQLRYAEFDVSSENWVTSNNALQGISILRTGGTSPLPPGINGIFALSNGTSAIGTEPDWYEAYHVSSGTTLYGPGLLSGLFPQPYAAYRVETVPIPEPSAVALAIIGAVAISVSQWRRLIAILRYCYDSHGSWIGKSGNS